MGCVIVPIRRVERIRFRVISGHPPIVESEIVLPGAPVLRELTSNRDRVAVVAEHAGEALREVGRGGVTPVPPHALIEAGGVHPVHAALVEVVHGQLPVGDADDRDRVRDLWMLVLRAPDDEPPAVEPLERAPATDGLAGEQRVSSLGLPATDEAVPPLELSLLGHVRRSVLEIAAQLLLPNSSRDAKAIATPVAMIAPTPASCSQVRLGECAAGTQCGPPHEMS